LQLKPDIIFYVRNILAENSPVAPLGERTMRIQRHLCGTSDISTLMSELEK